MCFKASLGKSKEDTISRTNWVWWFKPIILATQREQVGRSWSDAGLGKSMRPYLKNKLK
jgi:hypothetical protein